MGRMRRALAFLLVALALSACRVDTTVTVKVQPDGSGVITLTVDADADVVKAAPGLAKDLRLDDALAAGWATSGPTATAAGGLRLTITHPFTTVAEATALLASLNGTGGPLHDAVLARVVASGKVITSLHGTLRVDGGLDAFADPDVLSAVGGTPYASDIAAANLRPTDVVTFTFVADLPGELQSATQRSTAGSASGTAATVPANPRTFTVPIDGTAADLATTAVLAEGGSSTGWHVLAIAALVALVLWCVLAAGFIAFVARRRRQLGKRVTPLP
jgi:hypothetical protein